MPAGVRAADVQAGGVWDPGAWHWLVEPRWIGPVLRELERSVDPLFRRQGSSWAGKGYPARGPRLAIAPVGLRGETG
jgi:hypothetical protein